MQGILTPKEELIYYDGPLVYTFLENGELYLAYAGYRFQDEQDGHKSYHDDYMVLKMTEDEIENLKNGLLTPYEILIRDSVQIVRIHWAKEPSTEILESKLSERLSMIPEKGLTLYLD